MKWGFRPPPCPHISHTRAHIWLLGPRCCLPWRTKTPVCWALNNAPHPCLVMHLLQKARPHVCACRQPLDVCCCGRFVAALAMTLSRMLSEELRHNPASLRLLIWLSKLLVIVCGQDLVTQFCIAATAMPHFTTFEWADSSDSRPFCAV